MPRHDQVTRQWHILRCLEGTRGLTIEELVEALPAQFPKHPRTIRRDLAALEAANFPLVTERLDGQIRWRLTDGFQRMSAVTLSPSEVMALLLSRELLKPLEGTHLHAALSEILRKAAVAIPSTTDDRTLTGASRPRKTKRERRASLDRLTQAIAQGRTVQVRYFSVSRGRTGRREIDPYRLWSAPGGLYLVGYCHLRKNIRLFPMQRIRSVTTTDHPYQMPLAVDLDAYLRDALRVMRRSQSKRSTSSRKPRSPA